MASDQGSYSFIGTLYQFKIILEGVRQAWILETTMISVLSMSILLFLLAMIQVLLYVKVCFSSLVG